jgi:hypothetical protein
MKNLGMSEKSWKQSCYSLVDRTSTSSATRDINHRQIRVELQVRQPLCPITMRETHADRIASDDDAAMDLLACNAV